MGCLLEKVWEQAFSTHLFYDGPAAKYFVPSSFRPHNNLTKEDLSLPIIEKKTESKKTRQLPEGKDELVAQHLLC